MDFDWDDYKYIFKILIVGNCGVGKSSLIQRYMDRVFIGNYISTIGVDFKIKTIKIDGDIIKIQVWDTAGQERFKSICRTFFRNADGMMIVYDVTDLESFHGIPSWLKDIEMYASDCVSKLIVANKCDMVDKRKVDKTLIDCFSRSSGIKVIEASAKDSQNVEEAFISLVRDIKKEYDKKYLKNDMHLDKKTTVNIGNGPKAKGFCQCN